MGIKTALAALDIFQILCHPAVTQSNTPETSKASGATRNFAVHIEALPAVGVHKHARRPVTV